jgi:hypothetical protein
VLVGCAGQANVDEPLATKGEALSSAHARSGERLIKPLDADNSPAIWRPRKGEMPPAYAGSPVPNAQIDIVAQYVDDADSAGAD